MTIRWWYQPAEGMPADPAGQLTWLQRQWAMVDAWIQGQKGAPDLRGVAAGDPGRDDAGPGGDDAGPLLETPG
jgi:hypothetical protein